MKSLTELETPLTPECEKLSKHTAEWNVIYPFIEWLQENRMCIGVWRDPEQMAKDQGKTVKEIKFWSQYLLEHPYPYASGIDNLLYKYFGIDPAKLEQERRQLLEYMRKLNQKSP